MSSFFDQPRWRRGFAVVASLLSGILSGLIVDGHRAIGASVHVIVSAAWYLVAAPSGLLLILALRLPTAHAVWRRDRLSSIAFWVAMVAMVASIFPYAIYQIEARREGRYGPPSPESR